MVSPRMCGESACGLEEGVQIRMNKYQAPAAVLGIIAFVFLLAAIGTGMSIPQTTTMTMVTSTIVTNALDSQPVQYLEFFFYALFGILLVFSIGLAIYIQMVKS